LKNIATIRSRKAAALLLLILFFSLISSEVIAAQAGQILLNGRVKSIDLAASSVVITNYEGKDIRLSVEDQEILDKFRDRRIRVGDDVNVKYIIKDGKNVPFSLRKTAGC